MWEREIPDRDVVEFSLVLADRTTGAPLYQGAGRAEPQVFEPDGAGCGQSIALPPLTVAPGGSLAS